MARRKTEQDKKHARKRAEVILKKLTGQMTATQAAKELGVSRKTYYEWEKRGVDGMLGALEDRDSGRPSQPVDGEKESIKKLVTRMKKSLLKAEQRHSIRVYMDDELKVIEAIEKNGLKKK